MLPVVNRPTPPRENCPEVDECVADPNEIGHVCSFGPICGTCVVFRVAGTHHGLLEGTCRLQQERGRFPCTAFICKSYIPRAGAPEVKPEPPEPGTRKSTVAAPPSSRAPRNDRTPPARPVRTPVPDGPVGELEMTREELKALIREAMDEERGGAEVALAGKWEGGSLVLRPGNPELQAKEIPVDALFHKVVMIRDRLRVLEQKLNANPKLDDTEKVEMQGYITKCYGSLTTLNVLFRDREDQFQGEKSSGKDEE